VIDRWYFSRQRNRLEQNGGSQFFAFWQVFRRRPLNRNVSLQGDTMRRFAPLFLLALFLVVALFSTKLMLPRGFVFSMTADHTRIVDLIRDAFRDVELGDGVGLTEADGLDDYADPQTLAGYRSNDEKSDWSQISASELNRYYCSLSFFDAEGMRFHLPAYLIADLEGTFEQDVIFHLTYFENDAMSRFAMLSELQRNAVREFLLHRLADPNCEFERPMIEKALGEYWTTTDDAAD